VRHANEPVDPTLAEGIAWALAGRWSDESLDAVVSILETTKPPLDEYAVSRIVRLALASSTNARAGACALALLTAAAKTLPKSSAASVGPDVDALIFAVGELREMKARPLLVSLAKHEALTRSAKSALQRIVHGPNATGFHYGPRGRLIANKRKPRKKR
jgi:hypothetical protein